MEAFKSLPDVKKTRILKAALSCFGASGYKKTSISDIAAAAKISKAMIFHYFGTKKELYLYLMEYSFGIAINSFKESLPEIMDPKNSDFFERVKISTKIKLGYLKDNKEMNDFIASMYFESDPEVRHEIEKSLLQGETLRKSVAFKEIDNNKFKDGISFETVLKMLVWIAEGYISEIPKMQELNIDELVTEFYECLDLIRMNFYKEEYL